MLRILHPVIADRDCNHCRSVYYNEETGLPILTRHSKEEIKRPNDNKLPCDSGRCAKGHWKNPISLNERNRLAYSYHLRCKTTSNWPDDHIVYDNAQTIALAENRARDLQTWERDQYARKSYEALSLLAH